jgi:hypothetical protein
MRGCRRIERHTRLRGVGKDRFSNAAALPGGPYQRSDVLFAVARSAGGDGVGGDGEEWFESEPFILYLDAFRAEMIRPSSGIRVILGLRPASLSSVTFDLRIDCGVPFHACNKCVCFRNGVGWAGHDCTT